MELEQLIQDAKEAGASDVHFVCGLPPKYRIDGKMLSMPYPTLSKERCEAYAKELAGNEYEKIKTIGELDLATTMGGQRLRINLFRQQGAVSIAIRMLRSKIPKLEQLGLPPIIYEIPSWNKGLVLVTGETGSGKSTTLAGILNAINQTKNAHIITLEDPIEYIYEPALCVINQREIGVDTRSYTDGLRAVLREDPDVILIGEMRDKETMEIALTAAETGHLVFATLHTNSAVDSIDRIVGIFPAQRQDQIRLELSSCLKAVISQQLIPKKSEKGRVVACEILVVTSAIRNLIREGKTPQMFSAMLSGGAEGNVIMDHSLIRLVKEKIIDINTAYEAAHDKEFIKRNIK